MFGLNEAQIALLMRTNGIMSDMRSMGAPYVGRFGTFADGDYSPGANATLTKNMYMWRDVNIGAGITITVPSPGVLVFARDVTISGLLTASGKGAAGGAAVSASGTVVNGNPGANGGGVLGGDGGAAGGGSATGVVGGAGGKGAFIKNVLIDIFNALQLLAGAGGGGGGASSGTSGVGGAGGGYIFLTCNTLTVNSGGAIRADGINGGTGTGASGGGGGGGGGGIIIVAKNIVNNGNITAAKGLGGIKGSGYFYDGNPGTDGTVLLLEVA